MQKTKQTVGRTRSGAWDTWIFYKPFNMYLRNGNAFKTRNEARLAL